MIGIKYGFMFIFWIYLLEGCPGVDELINNSNFDTLMLKSIKSLLAGLDSMERHVDDLIFDTVFGFKVLGDQLKLAADKSNKSSNFENGLLTNCLNEIVTKCDELTNITKNKVQWRIPTFFDFIGKIIDTNWSIDADPRPVNLSLFQNKTQHGNIFHGSLSDFCLKNIVDLPGCVITPQCWEFNTEPGKSFYAITHQLLYFQTGSQSGCFEGNQTQIKDLIDNFCSNIFIESLEFEKLDFPKIVRDLFMEQVFLCGMEGFTEFFKTDWIESVISWQDKTLGCWHSKARDNAILTNISSPAEILKRQKRTELRLHDDCLCHETAMGLNVLGQYIKHQANQLENRS